ncbi:hypothetical protein [Cohnella terricola]|uniref:Fungal lipase-like domain-containing protein n=1 Tax=Cohnella terricola TaxID=1289167 RepID=A0A559JKJ2_9BACL|nr:hypothetical protein [Cohnella terricola]TVY00396.1 hypothetical protein FPZ45_10200 [Cohnella terricola]
MENKIEMYFLAGLATAPTFMEGLRIALGEKIGRFITPNRVADHSGSPVQSGLLFPYGDWSRKAIPQLWEIRADMRLGAERFSKSIGGNRVVASIESSGIGDGFSPVRGRTTLLVGHSGGGVAAVQAAEMLLRSGARSSCFAVTIGSPRCRIPERLKPFVLAIRAARGETDRRSPDIVSRLGSYGGWILGSRLRLPAWHKGKHEPGATVGLPIIGGHADYFRNRAPYVNEQGKSNLDLVVDTITEWLGYNAKYR